MVEILPEPAVEPPVTLPEPEVPESVPFEETAQAEVAPPPDDVVSDSTAAAPPVQGLSENSFAADGNTGLTVRAGTTLRVSATTPALEAPTPRPDVVQWSDAPKRPRCKAPRVDVPRSVIESKLEGEVHVRFDVSTDGGVGNVRVFSGLSADADAACVSAWSAVRCKPAKRGREAVAVSGMPHSCLFQAVD